MPVTEGQGNPDWNRDETILALDLLYRHSRPIDRHHSEVRELSTVLRTASFHPPEKRNDKFRNPDGVALKLQNLLSAVEPGRGLSYSKTDLAVVADFPKERARELAEIAERLRTMIGKEHYPDAPEEDEEFVEGAWLTVRHRQRDSRLRKKLLAKLKGGPLECAICDFSPPNLERALQESFFEAHHIIPLAEAEGKRTTRVADMALLCAGCHRLVHKITAVSRRWTAIEEARAVLLGARSKIA